MVTFKVAQITTFEKEENTWNQKNRDHAAPPFPVQGYAIPITTN
jgi:uncharacterized phage-like protein YoqJ